MTHNYICLTPIDEEVSQRYYLVRPLVVSQSSHRAGCRGVPRPLNVASAVRRRSALATDAVGLIAAALSFGLGPALTQIAVTERVRSGFAESELP